MKKIFFLIHLTIVIIMVAPAAYAHDDDWGRHDDWGRYNDGERHHRRHHHDHYYPQQQPRVYYYPAPQINYYPQPQVNYYQQPEYSRDPRSHQGLAGGVVGGVLGYEMGNGNPVTTGIGAAAGSFLGNEMNQDYRRRE